MTIAPLLLPHNVSKFSSPLSAWVLAAKKIPKFSMENAGNPGLKDKRGYMREAEAEAECAGKEACESNSIKVNRLSDRLMPHLLNLYGARATSRDFEMYHDNATFEDPLMCAHGVKQIKSAFYSLSKVFGESRIVEYSVTEKEISAGKNEILIDNKQQYKFLGRNIDMISLIRLYVEDGKVARHEDWWDKKPLWNRETVKIPLVGQMLELTRRGSMLATHALMGFGKDPNG